MLSQAIASSSRAAASGPTWIGTEADGAGQAAHGVLRRLVVRGEQGVELEPSACGSAALPANTVLNALTTLALGQQAGEHLGAGGPSPRGESPE